MVQKMNCETQLIYHGNLKVCFEDRNIHTEKEKHDINIKDLFETINKTLFETMNEKLSKEKNKGLKDNEKINKTLFEYIDVKHSSINSNQFSQYFLNDVVFAHMHVSVENANIIFGNIIPSNSKLSDNPLGLGKLPSYAPIEITIFQNGGLAIVFRLKHCLSSKKDYIEYLEGIKRSEYLEALKVLWAKYNCIEVCKNDCEFCLQQDPKPSPGKMIETINNNCAKYLLDPLIILLNSLNLKYLPLEDKVAKNFTLCNTREEKKSGKSIEIEISRPYIGTVHYAKGLDVKSNFIRLQRFSIAAARTTPELFTNFDNAQEFLAQGDPSRNIFDHKKKILFLSQRGWAYISNFDIIDDNKERAILEYSGIVETTLITIQIIVSVKPDRTR